MRRGSDHNKLGRDEGNEGGGLRRRLRCQEGTKVAIVNHPAREIPHDRLSLDVEVPEHLVGPPAADKTDDIRVDTGAKQRHSSGCAQGASGDVGRSKP